MANQIDWDGLFAAMTPEEAASMRDVVPRIKAWEDGMPQHREDMRVYNQILNKYTPQSRRSWIPFVLAVVLFILNLYVPLVKLTEVPMSTRLTVLLGSAVFAGIFTLGFQLKWRLVFVQFVSYFSTFMVLSGGSMVLLALLKAHPEITVPIVITFALPLMESNIPLWIKQYHSSEPLDIWLNITTLVANLGVEVLEAIVLAFIMTLFVTPLNYGWLCAVVCCVRVLWRSFGAKGTGTMTGGSLRMLGATSAGLMGVWVTYLLFR